MAVLLCANAFNNSKSTTNLGYRRIACWATILYKYHGMKWLVSDSYQPTSLLIKYHSIKSIIRDLTRAGLRIRIRVCWFDPDLDLEKYKTWHRSDHFSFNIFIDKSKSKSKHVWITFYFEKKCIRSDPYPFFFVRGSEQIRFFLTAISM